MSCFNCGNNRSGNRENRGRRGKMPNSFGQQGSRQREVTSNKKILLPILFLLFDDTVTLTFEARFWDNKHDIIFENFYIVPL
jgi:hypothetical protein